MENLRGVQRKALAPTHTGSLMQATLGGESGQVSGLPGPRSSTLVLSRAAGLKGRRSGGGRGKGAPSVSLEARRPSLSQTCDWLLLLQRFIWSSLCIYMYIYSFINTLKT